MVGLRTQFEAAKAYQNYENLSLIASKIFGSESSKPKAAQTFDELHSFINGIQG